MHNDISVSELLAKLNTDVQQWEKKRQLAEEALRQATARTDELRQTIAGLRRYIPEIENFSEHSSTRDDSVGEFYGMSTREAIKCVLQRANRPLPSADIAQQLIDGGIKSESASFKSNVSATLSVMQSKYQEVIKTPQGWILSQPNLAETHEAA
ncbi:MAG: hypothetical protein WB676_28375 [Bryobacteraceae bacterium]